MKKLYTILLACTVLTVFAQKQVITPYYDMQKNLFGYKDSLLNMAAIPAKYSFADRHFEGLARVESDGKWGFIAFSGKEVIPLIYDDALNMKDSLAAIKKDGKWGFINHSGNVIIPIKYDLVTSFNEKRAAIFKNNYWGFVDPQGHEVLECVFGYDDNVYPVYKSGLANVKFRENWGYVDLKGKIAIEFKYEYALPFDGEIAAVQLDGKWGFVNRKGKEIIPLKYDISDSFPVFKDGLCPVSIEGKYGYINRNGEEIIPLIYDYSSNFENGKGPVRLGSDAFYLNTKGERIK